MYVAILVSQQECNLVLLVLVPSCLSARRRAISVVVKGQNNLKKFCSVDGISKCWRLIIYHAGAAAKICLIGCPVLGD